MVPRNRILQRVRFTEEEFDERTNCTPHSLPISQLSTDSCLFTEQRAVGFGKSDTFTVRSSVCLRRLVDEKSEDAYLCTHIDTRQQPALREGRCGRKTTVHIRYQVCILRMYTSTTARSKDISGMMYLVFMSVLGRGLLHICIL